MLLSEPVRIYLPLPTPSLNTRKREHKFSSGGWRKKWAKYILPEIMRQGGREALEAKGKRKVIIERHGKKKLDADNLAGGAKELIDELRAAKLIIDDDAKHAELEFVQAPLGRGQVPHTIVVLFDYA